MLMKLAKTLKAKTLNSIGKLIRLQPTPFATQ